VRTRATAALIAALAVLGWVAPSASAMPASGDRTAAPPAPRPSGINDTAVIVGGAVVLLLALVIFLVRRRPRRPRRPRAGGGVGTMARQDAPQGAAIEELAAQVSPALVAADDAIRTSEQELGFVTATLGEHATAVFAAAVQSARAELSAAVGLRQLLDSDISDEKAIRAHLTEISVHCAEASRLLDQHSAEFDRLQDLDGRAPQLAAEVDAHLAQQAARISRSRQILDRLVAKYTAGAVVAVMTNPDLAADRLGFAARSLASAQQNLAGGRRHEAAILLQAAESGADQATDLLDAVEHMEAELTQAASALPGALREVDAEIAEAAGLLAERPQDERATLLARAQAVADDVRRQQAEGAFDALAALRDVQQVDAALDLTLASARPEPARRERATAVLDQAMLVARSSVKTADDFITTRRGGVGATARTRLIAGQRHFRQAIASAQDDPVAALAEAQHADALAQEARVLAEQDVAGFDYRTATWPALVGGAVDGLAVGVGSAILGGILIPSPLRAGAWGRGIGPASFGGTVTRGRHKIRDARATRDAHVAQDDHATRDEQMVRDRL
jgi:hypothetical protein